jgi:hypothetical protein
VIPATPVKIHYRLTPHNRHRRCRSLSLLPIHRAAMSTWRAIWLPAAEVKDGVRGAIPETESFRQGQAGFRTARNGVTSL